MSLIVVFAIFTASMIGMLVTGQSMVWALCIGLVLFGILGMNILTRGEEKLEKGLAFRELVKHSANSIKESLIVIEVMLVIGFITAAWRVSGTITVFVYYGMKIIVPPLFLIITFCLTCLLSYALGTSFGVAGTVGVIFMALARSGGVDPLMAAGVIMSGIYFGDRASPVSSSANMVAGITGTEIIPNVKLMMKTGMVPFAITLIAYSVISFMNPISHVDPQVLKSFEETFTLSAWSFLPAAIMLILPLLKVGIITSIGISVGCSVIVGWAVEKTAILTLLKTLVFGYTSADEGLGAILNGGGMVSMLEVVVILIISCAYSGIFNRTNMLEKVLMLIEDMCKKSGRYTVSFLLGVATCVLFCNQTIASLMCNDLLQKPYLNTGGSRQELAIDLENTVIMIAGLVPWCIGCAVPLNFLGVGPGALPWSIYVYLLPLSYFILKRRWFADR